MGKFFNEMVLGMDANEIKKRKKTVVVTNSPVWGQTKGYLEADRKEFNEAQSEPEPGPETEPELEPVPEEDSAPLYISNKDRAAIEATKEEVEEEPLAELASKARRYGRNA
mgnify:FL=1|jgi:hypothetical protein|tara:strand:+ start:6251 stop:6583 length:333 start_codon:yes stop_codon:yes gene_type:complete